MADENETTEDLQAKLEDLLEKRRTNNASEEDLEKRDTERNRLTAAISRLKKKMNKIVEQRKEYDGKEAGRECAANWENKKKLNNVSKGWPSLRSTEYKSNAVLAVVDHTGSTYGSRRNGIPAWTLS